MGEEEEEGVGTILRSGNLQFSIVLITSEQDKTNTS